MINVKKGTAHSLLQTDKVGLISDGEAVVAGMLVHLDPTDGTILKGVTATPLNALLGFALNEQTDGDVIESGKLGIYQLDGNSVIETDQAADDITSTNYPAGTALYGEVSSGLVTTDNTADRIIGWVDGIRSLPSVEDVGGVKVQSFRALLGIKLAA